MKFQNCILINFVTDGWTDGQGKSNMRLQLFQSWGIKTDHQTTKRVCFTLIQELVTHLQWSKDGYNILKKMQDVINITCPHIYFFGLFLMFKLILQKSKVPLGT